MKRLLFPLAMLALTACQPEPNVALRIDCGPYNDQGVGIQLNGQAVGECPLDIMTLAGQTEVEIHKLFSDSGFIQERQTLQLAENVNKRVIFQPKLQYPERHYYELATTVAGAAEYLKRFPNGQYAAQVTATARQLEEASYNKAVDLEGVTAYLKLYPVGHRSVEVKAKREQLEQEEASYKKAVDLEGMAAYLKLYPAGHHSVEVKAKREQLEKLEKLELAKQQEEASYKEAIDLEGIAAYLKLYPAGRHSAEVKTKREQLRLIADRWYDNLDGTITDRKTKLIWMRCSIGQIWSDGSCVGELKKFNWPEIISYTQGVTFAGHSDWRVPTVRELFSLVVCSTEYGLWSVDIKDGRSALPAGCVGSHATPTIDERAFPNTPRDTYWSSSADADNAWYVYFFNGYVDLTGKSHLWNARLRLVRSGH